MDKPELLAAKTDKTSLQTDITSLHGFDLRSGQRNTGLKLFEDFVIKTALFVLFQ